jgi:hypothetical protein
VVRPRPGGGPPTVGHHGMVVDSFGQTTTKRTIGGAKGPAIGVKKSIIDNNNRLVVSRLTSSSWENRKHFGKECKLG